MASKRKKVYEIHPDPGFYQQRFRLRTFFLTAAIAAGWAGYLGEKTAPSLLYFMGSVSCMAVVLTAWGYRRLTFALQALPQQVYQANERSLVCPAMNGRKKRELLWAQLKSGSFLRRLGGWDLKLTFQDGSLTIKAVANVEAVRDYLQTLSLIGEDAPIKDSVDETQLEMPISFYFSLAPAIGVILLDLVRPVRDEYLFGMLFLNLTTSLLVARKKIISKTGSKKIAAQLWTPLSLSFIFLVVSLFFLYTNSADLGYWPNFFEP